MTSITAHQVVIHAAPQEYATFPSIQRAAPVAGAPDAPASLLYAVFRNAPNDLGEGHYSHIDVRSVAILKQSTDGGHNWRQIGEPITGHLPKSGVQDPSLTILANGVFLLTYFHWRHEPDHPRARQGAVMEGVWVRRSTDHGQRWDEPVHVPADDHVQMAISEPAIELPDGTLMLVGYASIPKGGGQAALFSRSTDGGATWSKPAIIAHDPNGVLDYQEPALLHLGEGHLLCVMRTVDRNITEGLPDEAANRRARTAWMHQSHSYDNGATWSPAQRTDMYGHPPNLIRLQDGRVLCSYGHRREPFGIRACLSLDIDMTWDVENEVVLRADGGGFDLGYPSSVELDDGSILTSYYIHTADDATRRVEASVWRPDR